MSRGSSFDRRISLCLAVLLVLPIRAHASLLSADAQTAPAQSYSDSQKTSMTDSNQPPGQSAPEGTSPSQSTTSQQSDQAPRGTAAAPELRPDGVPASNASGAAIAPVKQKRIRRFSVAAALVIGAAVAVGVVIGLSAASPARQ